MASIALGIASPALSSALEQPAINDLGVETGVKCAADPAPFFSGLRMIESALLDSSGCSFSRWRRAYTR